MEEAVACGLWRGHDLKVGGEPGNPKQPAQANSRHHSVATASRQHHDGDPTPAEGPEGEGTQTPPLAQ